MSEFWLNSCLNFSEFYLNLSWFCLNTSEPLHALILNICWNWDCFCLNFAEFCLNTSEPCLNISEIVWIFLNSWLKLSELRLNISEIVWILAETVPISTMVQKYSDKFQQNSDKNSPNFSKCSDIRFRSIQT